MSSNHQVEDLEGFCLLLAASWLIKPAEIVRLLQEFRLSASSLHDDEQLTGFSHFLNSKNAITPWQLSLLQQGKYKGFFLERYVLLDVVELLSTHTRYLAKEYSSGRRIILCVKPPTARAPGEPEFWTEENAD